MSHCAVPGSARCRLEGAARGRVGSARGARGSDGCGRTTPRVARSGDHDTRRVATRAASDVRARVRPGAAGLLMPCSVREAGDVPCLSGSGAGREKELALFRLRATSVRFDSWHRRRYRCCSSSRCFRDRLVRPRCCRDRLVRSRRCRDRLVRSRARAHRHICCLLRRPCGGGAVCPRRWLQDASPLRWTLAKRASLPASNDWGLCRRWIDRTLSCSISRCRSAC